MKKIGINFDVPTSEKIVKILGKRNDWVSKNVVHKTEELINFSTYFRSLGNSSRSELH